MQGGGRAAISDKWACYSVGTHSCATTSTLSSNNGSHKARLDNTNYAA